MTVDRPRLVVCLKWVPTRVEIDRLTGAVVTDERFAGISAADAMALEMAMRTAESSPHGCSVEAVTVGGQPADGALRIALGVGAASAIRVDWSGAAEADSDAVATALAPVAAGAALVYCGDYSLDRGSGSVPAFLANELGYGQALGCLDLVVGDLGAPANYGTVTRRLDQGRRERLALCGPTVLSFEGGTELRRASLGDRMDADAAKIAVIPASAKPQTRLPIVSTGPYRPRAKVLPAPDGSTRERIRSLVGTGEDQRVTGQPRELDPARAAAAVVDSLRRWGYIENQPDQHTDDGGNR